METSDQDRVIIHSFGLMLGQGGSSEPQPEQRPESETEATEQRRRPLTLTQIEFRMQHLNNRRLLLLEIQRCRKEAQKGGEPKQDDPTEDGLPDPTEDVEAVSELTDIQKELEELLVKKEELERTGRSFKEHTSDGHQKKTSYKEKPRGGIYMLPPFQPNQEATDASRRLPVIYPAETLGQKAELTQCPSCEEVVVTETHSTRGGAMWVVCFLCSIMGCVAGCCLIPFYMKRLRNVHHHCPVCRANIHTHNPL